MEPRRTEYLRGQRFGGYTIEEELGRGSLTSIYRVRKRGDAQTHVLMVITLPEHLSERGRERFLARFDRCSARLADLRHPHIFPVEGWGQQSDDPYLLLPDIEAGKTLADELRLHGRCSLAYAAAVVDRVAETLEYAHSHDILHRGLSPAHILLREELFVQVTGFGLAQLLEMQGVEDTTGEPQAHLKALAGGFFAPAEYLAPEVVQGSPPSARADVYALGILLFEMLSGQPPFHTDSYLETALQHVRSRLPSLHALCPEVPLALELVIHQALKRDPGQRFQSPRDLASACMRVLTRRPFSIVTMARTQSGVPGVETAASGQGHHWDTERSSTRETLATSSAVERDEAESLGLAGMRQTRTSLRVQPSVQAKPRADAGQSVARRTIKLEPAGNGGRGEPGRAHGGTNEEQMGALFTVLEGMPRPSYGEALGGRMLVQVPEPVPSGGLSSLRSRIENALSELLPVPATPTALWRRRRFDNMFPHG